MFKIEYQFNPGDVIAQHWKVEGQDILTALYLIYGKTDVLHETMPDLGYASYKAYVLFSYDPYKRTDRSGLLSVGETYEIIQWNDWDVLNPDFPCEWIKVVESVLSWEDVA